MKKQVLPKARIDCLSRKLDEELVVYDPERHVGHCLNSTATSVWTLCDGRRSPAQIAAELSQQASAQVEQRVVQLALEQLEDVHLLLQPEVRPKLPPRRIAIRRLGIAAAVALPLVTSIVAPTPASAASCTAHLGVCGTGKPPCCPGSTCLLSGVLGGLFCL